MTFYFSCVFLELFGFFYAFLLIFFFLMLFFNDFFVFCISVCFFMMRYEINEMLCFFCFS